MAAVSLCADFIAAVEQATGKPGRKQGRNTRLLCPAHDDHNPSLDVAEAADGSPLVKCRVCEAGLAEVCAALGREQAEFLPERGQLVKGNPNDRWTPRGEAVAVYVYTDEDGRIVQRVSRTSDKEFPQSVPDPNARSGWRWRDVGKTLDGNRVLYRLPEVVAAIDGEQRIYLCEGEKDVDAIRATGAIATCNPGGAGKWWPELTRQLAGAAEVVIIADNDEQGLAHAHRVLHEIAGHVRTVRVVQAAAGKDAHDHLGAGKTLDELVPIDEPVGPAPFAVDLDTFIAQEDEDVEPLLGSAEEAIIPVGGLIIVAGQPGIGKTTLVLDGVFALASGGEWLDIAVPRPLRILILENEGPTREFRKKLRLKKEKWAHRIQGQVFVQTWRWGGFSFADDEARQRLRAFLEEQQIDLVVGDPLGSLGISGVGSPEDTRAFVAHLVELGLTRDRTFLFLHHFRKEPTADELNQVSGSWGGHLDTLMVLKATAASDQLRLSFPKLRWAPGGTRKPLILGIVRNTQSFEVLGEEGDASLLVPQIADLLKQGPRTATEIASASKGGIGVKRVHVEAALEGNQHVFEKVSGKEVGRRGNAVCWRLRQQATITKDDDEADDWRELVDPDDLAWR